MALGAALHYGWALVPVQHQAQVWNACGAAVRAILLLLLAWRVRSWFVVAVVAWWLCEELMVAGCSIAYIVRPWPIPKGQAQCSALLQFDIGKAGIVVLCALLASVKLYRVRND